MAKKRAKPKKRKILSKKRPPAKKVKKTRRKTVRPKNRAKSGTHKPSSKIFLVKHRSNPIIKPSHRNEWESWQTFNPAAVLEDGKVHFIYRAIGNDGISRFGYASSLDGFNINDRHNEPVFQLKNINPSNAVKIEYYSGGSWGGAEDPRITKLDDKLHMLFVALSGLPVLAMTSINWNDFINHKWKWGGVKIISSPGIIDKSGCLFPEKINGKYAIIHRIFPNMLIDMVDDLDFKNGKHLSGEEALWGKKAIKVRKGQWDSLKIGAGAPPIKTDKGWFLIYYGVSEKERKYKIGAMLLDLKNPTKVLARTDKPILDPVDWYENVGHKSGVAYPCGAVVKDGELFVYYGGADSYVCVARTNFDKFLNELVKTGKPGKLSAVKQPKHVKS